MTRFTLHTHTHWATKIFSHNKQKFAPNCSCSSVVEKQRYKDTKAHIIIETLKIGISELQFVNCIQIHANDQLSRVAVGEWVGERERGGISAKGGVFAGNAPWNWSSHLKQFESAHMLCPKLNWTELNPCCPSADANTAKRYTKIQKDTKIHRCSYKWVRCEALQSVVCLMVDLLDLSPPSPSLCLSGSKICAYVWSKVVCLLVFSPFEPLITRATCRQGRR